MDFIFFNDQFYSDYNPKLYKQIEQKKNRPYIHVRISIGNKDFAIPLRSTIKHPYCFYTDKRNLCGVDYSKVIPIKDKYINKDLKPYIRDNEYKKLKGKEGILRNGLLKYIKTYKEALNNENYNHRNEILSNSTIQYFHDDFDI